MKRIVVAVSSVIALIAFTVTVGGAAWSAAGSSSTAVITFDDANHQALLLIPTPACPASQPDCRWKFFLNEPKLSVDVGTVYGTSGTLAIPYPKDFCGVIQADAYRGPPWDAQRGFQHTIEDCHTPSTTTTEPSTTTTKPSPTPTSTTVVTPPTVVSKAAPPAPPTPPPASTPTPTPVAVPTAVTPTQLPFTGRSIKPFLFMGLTLVALGLCLLTSGRSWRKLARRISAISPRFGLSPRLEMASRVAGRHARALASTLGRRSYPGLTLSYLTVVGGLSRSGPVISTRFDGSTGATDGHRGIR